MTTNTNPWNLTKGQVAVMDAICENGCQKLAARALGMAQKTVESQAYLAGVRMKKRSYLLNEAARQGPLAWAVIRRILLFGLLRYRKRWRIIEPSTQQPENEMADLNTARDFAGAAFADMADDEVLGTLVEIERLIRRPLSAAYAQVFRDALEQRRTYLEKKAGKAQPEFVPAMYGTPAPTALERAMDNNEQGEG